MRLSTLAGMLREILTKQLITTYALNASVLKSAHSTTQVCLNTSTTGALGDWKVDAHCESQIEEFQFLVESAGNLKGAVASTAFNLDSV
jgi:hypothetical protein